MGDSGAYRQPPGADPGPAGPVRTLLTRPFVLADIAELRQEVCRCAIAAGLTGQLLDDFVLAINELVTNAVRHGGGAGMLSLWQMDGELVCEVSDHGGGIADRADGGFRRPPPSRVGGWGLWLARQLSDSMAVVTGTSGTAVRISAALPAARSGGVRSD